MPTAAIQRHWDQVGQLRCVVSARPAPTLHHCHSGSISKLGITRGISQKPSDWLVIPLDAEFHTGKYGIDTGMGVEVWEKRFGSQEGHLDEVCRLLGFNVWQKAGIEREVAI